MQTGRCARRAPARFRCVGPEVWEVFMFSRFGIAATLATTIVMAVAVSAAQATTVVHTTFNGSTSSLSDNGTVTFGPPDASFGCTGGTGNLTKTGQSVGCYAFAVNVPAVGGTCVTITTGGRQASCSGHIASSGPYNTTQR